MKKDKYISLKEATKFCGYSQEYLSLRARHGKLKAIKFGRNWVTTKEWLEEYSKNVDDYNNQVLQTKKTLSSSDNLISETRKVGSENKPICMPIVSGLKMVAKGTLLFVLILLLLFAGITFNNDEINYQKFVESMGGFTYDCLSSYDNFSNRLSTNIDKEINETLDVFGKINNMANDFSIAFNDFAINADKKIVIAADKLNNFIIDTDYGRLDNMIANIGDALNGLNSDTIALEEDIKVLNGDINNQMSSILSMSANRLKKTPIYAKNGLDGALIGISNLIDDKFVVKENTQASIVSGFGIVVYDQANNKPYCIYINNGEMKNIPGDCSDLKLNK